MLTFLLFMMSLCDITVTSGIMSCQWHETDEQTSYMMSVKHHVWHLTVPGKAFPNWGQNPISEEQWLDCYIDANFTGMWNRQDSDDLNSVKSRTGYIIVFTNCLVLWVSKLQTEIALLMMEAEYIASSRQCNIILMQTLCTEIVKLTKLKTGKTIAHSTVFEDNKGCVELVAVPNMQPHTKHITNKHHHFWEHVCRGDVQVQWIDTKSQLADIFTKPLGEPLFWSLREQLLLRWWNSWAI